MTQQEQITAITAEGAEVVFSMGRLALRVQNRRTGNGWTERVEETDGAAEIAAKAAEARKRVGIAAKRTARAIRAEKAES